MGVPPPSQSFVRGRAFTSIFLPRKLGKKDFRSIPNASPRTAPACADYANLVYPDSTSVAQRHQGAIRERKGVFHSGGVGTDTFDQSFELDFGS
ncbi:MAG: hypothetical protein LBQ31_05575, partial [Bacteroidales bacterium]|nr:hypothetical protein [Bacteroidales bacterium]